MAWRLALAALLVLSASGCGNSDDDFPSGSELEQQIRPLLKRLPVSGSERTNFLTGLRDTDPRVARARALGKRLFEDPTLSTCGTVACASCHQPPTFASSTAKSVGCTGVDSLRNAPSLLNVGSRRWLYWDGRKETLWGHPSLPLTRDIEMAAVPSEALAHVDGDPTYRDDYLTVFGVAPAEQDTGHFLANFGKSIDMYLRTLVKVSSPFDELLPGYIEAASRFDGSAAKHPLHEPLKVFIRRGKCIACHKGSFFSDEDFHNVGLDDQGTGDRGRMNGIGLVLADPFTSEGLYSDSAPTGKLDALRGTDPAQMEGAFKTPTLRNVALTAPYMHTGKLATLEQVVDFYDRGGDPVGTFAGLRTATIQPLKLTAAEKQTLVELLEMLTGSETP